MRMKIPDNLISRIKGMKPERYEFNDKRTATLFYDVYADLLPYLDRLKICGAMVAMIRRARSE